MAHICVDNLTVIGSDNGCRLAGAKPLSDGILLIGPSGTNFSEVLIEIHIFSLKKMSSEKRRPFCLGFNVLNNKCLYMRCIYQLTPFRALALVLEIC